MIKRYPDKGAIVFSKELVSADGISGIDVDAETEIVIDCRYEARDSFTGNYSAKVFTPSAGLTGFQGDGYKFRFMGRTFNILRISPHQTHSEIWLK